MSRIVIYKGTTPGQRSALFKAGNNITFSEATVGGQFEVTVSSTGGGGGGAPTNAQYVTLATDTSLTGERVLTAGANINIVDGGAGNAVTLSAVVPAAASTVVTETNYGQSSAVGVATTFARADHTHGTPALPGHNTLSNLAWANAGHTGASTAVAAWNGSGTATVVQATSDETMLVRRGGTLQWVAIIASIGMYGGDLVDAGTALFPNGAQVFSGSIV